MSRDGTPSHTPSRDVEVESFHSRQSSVKDAGVIAGLGDGRAGLEAAMARLDDEALRNIRRNNDFFFGNVITEGAVAASRRRSTIDPEQGLSRRTSAAVAPATVPGSPDGTTRLTPDNSAPGTPDAPGSPSRKRKVGRLKSFSAQDTGISPAKPADIDKPGWLQAFQGWALEYYHGTILHDIYPDSTRTTDERWQIYMDRRAPPTHRVQWYHLLALGVSAVISGEFSGWNNGLDSAGYGGFWISTALAALLYAGIASSIVELSAAIPLPGGVFAYVRAVLGNSVAFLVGNSENLEYCMFVSLLLVGFGDCAAEILNVDADRWGPLLWLVFLVPAIYLVNQKNNLNWTIMVGLTVVAVIQICVFCIIAASRLDSVWATTSLPVNVSPFDPCLCKTPILNGDGESIGCTAPITPKPSVCTLPLITSVRNVLISLPDAAWWFTGLECISLATKESLHPIRDVKKALWGSWGSLLAMAVLLSIFNLQTAPGAYVLKDSKYPMVDVLVTFFGEQSRRGLVFWQLPAFFANMIGMLWCSSRQTWALSRAGFLPNFLSITEDNRDKVPTRATYFTALYGYLMALFVIYTRNWHGNGLTSSAVLLDLTVIAAGVTYIGIGVCYVAFRFRHPYVPRPVQSPLGLFGAFAVIAISATMLVTGLSTSWNFQLTVVFLIVKLMISGAYFVFQGRLHLLPTEEAILPEFWTQIEREQNRQIVREALKEGVKTNARLATEKQTVINSSNIEPSKDNNT